MKLEKIRFSNLASLRGEWQIDLTGKAFQDAGIFALSGPVGSGKTTVFDAVRLALFGQTSRLSKITTSENEIMTRGTNDCFAELVFSNEQGRFLCRWSQHKAKSGQLQPAKHIFAEFKEGALEADILTSKLEETRERIRSVINMDFKHFSRAMILPQGQLAGFLQAGPDERAPILEQITGTGIYAEISMKVHEICRGLDHELELLEASANGVELIPEEQIAEWKERLDASHLVEKELKAGWQFKTELLRNRKNLETERAGLLHLEKESPSLERDFNLASDAVVESEKALAALKLKLETLTPVLLRIRETDSAIRMRSGYLNELELALSSAEKQYEKDVARQKENSKKLEDEQKALECVLISLKERAEDASLSAELSGLRLAVGNRNSLAAVCVDFQKKSEKAKLDEKILREKIVALQNAYEAAVRVFSASELLLKERERDLTGLLGGRSVPEFFAHRDFLRAKTETLERMLLLFERETMNGTAESLLKQKNVANSNSHAGNSAELEAKQKLKDQLSMNLRLLDEKRIAEAKIASYEKDRKALSSGSPCPLCGALSHPYAENVPVPAAENESVAVRLELEKILRDISSLEKESVRLKFDAENLRKKSEEIIAEKEKIHLEWDAFSWLEYGATRSEPIFYEKLREAASSVSSDYNQCNAFGALIELKTKEKNDAEMKWRSAEKNQVSAELEWKTAEKDLSAQSELRVRIGADLAEKQNELQAADDALRASFNQYKIELEASFTAALSILENRAAGFEAKQADYARLEKEIIRLKTGVQAEAERLEKEKSNLEKQRGDREKRKQELDDLKRARIAEFGERSPDVEERTAGNEIKTADDEWKNRSAALKKISEQHNTLKTRIAEANERIEKLKALILASGSETEQPLELLEAEIADLELRRSEEARVAHGLSIELERAVKAGERAASLMKDIEEKRKVRAGWEYLNSLIGSADGKKYREFVQSLTLETLIEGANEQLTRFSDRYTLSTDSETGLKFNVTDAYRGNEVRSSQNLSGGETFLISLALALGLSRMARNRVRIDTLFLDEGFGTLDSDSLQHALEQLAGLRQSGKLIGIITHAHGIEDAVPIVLRFTTCGGHSSISGPGVTEIRTV